MLRKSARVAGELESAYLRALVIAHHVVAKVVSLCCNPPESVPGVTETGLIRTPWIRLARHVPAAGGRSIGGGRTQPNIGG